MYVLLRLIAHCPDAASLKRLADTAEAALTPWQARATCPPEPRPGPPGQFELTYQLQPGVRATLDALVGATPGLWHVSGDEDDASAVWRPGEGPALVAPAVVWAELIYSANGQLG